MEGPGGGTIRAFLALPLSEAQRGEIAGKLAPLLGARDPVRWVGPENLHVTLRFFGDVGPDGRRRIEERVVGLDAEFLAPLRAHLAQHVDLPQAV